MHCSVQAGKFGTERKWLISWNAMYVLVRIYICEKKLCFPKEEPKKACEWTHLHHYHFLGLYFLKYSEIKIIYCYSLSFKEQQFKSSSA